MNLHSLLQRSRNCLKLMTFSSKFLLQFLYFPEISKCSKCHRLNLLSRFIIIGAAFPSFYCDLYRIAWVKKSIHSQSMRPWNSKLPGVEFCECSYPLHAIDNAKFSQRDQRNKNFTEEETISGERKSGCKIYWAKVWARAWVQMDMLRILQILGGPNSNSSIRHLHQ